MPPALRTIKTFPTLLAYLRDKYGWPYDAAFDEVVFDYTPADLNIEPADFVPPVVHLLRPPAKTRMPWGVVLLNFADRRLSIAVLRKFLRGFVQTQRAAADRPQWQLEHLLFVCTHKADDGDALSFVHFEQPDARRAAKLTSFGWTDLSANRTVLEYNLPRLTWPADEKDAAKWIADWQAAFDVEAVTKKFFTEYREVFDAVEAKIKGVPAGEKRRLYTQRLFNRLLFLYFIQRKGWLAFAGRKNYLRALFEMSLAHKENFLNDRLYWTFFYGLNNGMEDAAAHSLAELEERRGTVPFLNGGLFDLEDDYDIHEAVTIPNASFALILDLFERFNFTVSESTPLDIEVAVDPEMLGKVFEELVTGRHESGSYYTPRPVVAFMCREALKHHLAAVETNAAAVAKFIDDGDATALCAPEKVLASLKKVTVCDPACGSGAYLLGMMHELVRLRDTLFVAHKIDPIHAFERKREIIQDSIYGTDLDPFAVNIAKLRLWLSLIVDFNGVTPPPLPNLEFKIECGDSLLAPHPDLASVAGRKVKAVTNTLFRDLLTTSADALITLKADYLKKHTADKKLLRAKILAHEARLRDELAEQIPDGTIDWRVNFAEVFRDGGFDVVLGNPPYVRQEQIKHLKPELKKHYACYSGVADLFIYFYERGIRLLKPGGQFAFITSNKWYRSGYGEKLRAWLAENTRLHGLIDFGDAPVFDAIAYPTIVLLERSPPAADASFRGLTWQPGPKVDDFAAVFRADAFAIPQASLHKGGWRLEGDAKRNLLDKLRAAGTPLGEYCQGRFYRGVLTGLNDAFVVDRATRDRLIKEHKSSAAVLKPFLRGRDVKRWRVEPQDLWLLFIPWHYPLHDDATIKGSSNVAEKRFAKECPAVYEHLRKFKTELSARNKTETGIRYEWYALQRWGAEHWREFEQDKIIIPAITGNVNFALDSGKYFINNKATMFIAPSPSLAIAVCNSPVCMWLVRQTFASKQGGFFDFEPRYSSTIPIPAAPPTEQAALETLVRQIVAAKAADPAADVTAAEAAINARVYKLFGLTREEIAVIEGA